MRSVLLAISLAAVAFTAACSADNSVDIPDVTGEDQERELPADCQPTTCEDAGAECGTVDDGCGGVLDCAGCEVGVCGAGGQPNVCSTSACVPRTCEDAEAECGLADDGCGGTLDCGASCSGEAVCSDDNQCVIPSCSGEGKNACGTCGVLPAEPGTDCECEGTASCTVYGIQCDDGGPQMLDDTDDGVDEWTEVSGIAELTVQAWEYDEYQVVVADESFSFLEPEFEIVHPGGYELNVCVIMEGLDGPVEAFCGGNDDAIDHIDDGVRRGCCLTAYAEDQGVSRFELDFPFLAPLHDYSARYTLQVRALRTELSAPVDSCEPYGLRYRF